MLPADCAVLSSSAAFPGVVLGAPLGGTWAPLSPPPPWSPAAELSGATVVGGGGVANGCPPWPSSWLVLVLWVVENVFVCPSVLASALPEAAVGTLSALLGDPVAVGGCMRPVSASVSKGSCLIGFGIESSLTVCPAVLGGVGTTGA